MRMARLPDTPPYTYDRRVCYWIQKSINHQATESGNDGIARDYGQNCQI